ncbi:MAG: phospholipase D family protein [Planctomycetota bacterium]
MIKFIANHGADEDNHLRVLQDEIGKVQHRVRMAFPFWSTIPVLELFEKLYPRIAHSVRKPIQIDWLMNLNDKSLLQGTSNAAVIAAIHDDLVKDGLATLNARYITPTIRYGGLHAKMFVFDEKSVLITSANPTNNGLKSNIEAGILTDDPEVVSQVIKTLDRIWSIARELSLSEARQLQDDVVAAQTAVDGVVSQIAAAAETIKIEPATYMPPKVAARNAGASKFGGIKPEWFDRFKHGTPKSKDEVQENCEDLRELLEPPFRIFWTEVRMLLTSAIAGLNFHFSRRLQLRNRFPGHMWFAISRERRRYITIAHLSCGIGMYAKEGPSLFVGFYLNEEYAENEERKRWIERFDQQRDFYFGLCKQLHPDFALTFNDSKTIPIREINDGVVDELVRRKNERLDISIQRTYALAKYKDLLTTPKLIQEMAAQLEKLFPLMNFN